MRVECWVSIKGTAIMVWAGIPHISTYDPVGIYVSIYIYILVHGALALGTL